MDSLFLLTSVAMLASCRGENSPRPLSHSKKLHDDLFRYYGATSVRPVRNGSLPVEVEYYFKPSILSKFDEQSQHLSVIGQLYMGWSDEFLTWDPEEYGGISRVSVKPDDIWFPDITAYQRIQPGSAMVNMFAPYAVVHSNGFVKYYDLSELTIYCRLMMTLFPFDTQRCKIRFTSYSYDSNQVSLGYANSSNAMENIFDPNGVWILDHFEVEQVDVYYLCCESPYVELHYTLVLNRIGNFYIYSIWIPSCLLSTMILAVFVMHPNSGEKVSLSVSNVLAFVLFQQIVIGSMPRSGDDSPIIVAFFSAMIAISCLSVLGSAVVLRLYHHDPKKPVPRVFKWLCMRNKTDGVTELTLAAPLYMNHGGSPEDDLNTANKGYDNILLEGMDEQTPSSNQNEQRDVPFSELQLNYQHRHRRHEVLETDWMILALMMDKVLLAMAVIALLGTVFYCAISYLVLIE